MDWEITKQQGKNRHYINNEVLGLASICGMKRYSEAINIVIERIENQPFLEENIEDEKFNTEVI